MAADLLRFLAPSAWVGGAWAHDVLLTVGSDGCWSEITPNAAPEASRGATKLAGPVLPGLVDAHSHAFQRAIAGLTERSEDGDEDFWSWRDRMYRVAHHVTPGQLEAIAAFLYAELLRAGYTQVCEFHYLHNDPQGRPYAEPGEMALALVRAAQRVGIGLTLLPTLYMRSGFGATDLREDQRRFGSTPDSVWRIARETVRQAGEGSGITAGIALHSLRAVDKGALREAAEAAGADMPIHIHIAEQRREVEDCIALYGRAPVEWLCEQVAVDARWNMVHATHCTPGELEELRNRRASIVLCPSTEANLGDGIFDLPSWLGQSGNWSIGSDSPCHAQLAGRVAAARIFAAPGPAPAQRRLARGLVREHGHCLVPGGAGRRDHGRGAAAGRLGHRTARRLRGRGYRVALAAGRARRPFARCAGFFQPGRSVYSSLRCRAPGVGGWAGARFCARRCGAQETCDPGSRRLCGLCGRSLGNCHTQG